MTTTISREIGALTLGYVGPLHSIPEATRNRLFNRSTSSDEGVRVATAEIIDRVRRDGDRALFELALELDGVALETLEIPRRRWASAADRLDAQLRRAMDRAASNIAAVHRAFLPQRTETSPEPGVVVGRRPDPLGRVGIYAPGGRASYPSSVLMGAVPAKVAGVGEIIVCSPPAGGTAGPLDVVLAAAHIAEADRVFAVGGAGAIAAMAHGTGSIPRVDRIIGPGSVYVAEAKLQLSGTVGIDAPAGPSELLVIADDSANVTAIARELLAQAEHDPRACVVAVTIGEQLARDLARALASELDSQPRRDIVAASLAAQGAILWTDHVDDAVSFSNEYAAEHLLLALRDAEGVCERCRNAGTVFLGESSSVTFGDYMTGANHVLPTGGLARSYSGLSIADFFRWTTYQRVTSDAAIALAPDVAAFATAEGLPGHAMAASRWRANERSAQ